MQTLDELRAAYPTLGFALYALEPQGDVALEIIDTETGEIVTLRAETEAAVIALAHVPEEDIFT